MKIETGKCCKTHKRLNPSWKIWKRKRKVEWVLSQELKRREVTNRSCFYQIIIPRNPEKISKFIRKSLRILSSFLTSSSPSKLLSSMTFSSLSWLSIFQITFLLGISFILLFFWRSKLLTRAWAAMLLSNNNSKKSRQEWERKDNVCCRLKPSWKWATTLSWFLHSLSFYCFLEFSVFIFLSIRFLSTCKLYFAQL